VRTYAKCLRRFDDFLAARGLQPDAMTTERIAEDALERFATWLLRDSGVESRASVQTYVAGARAFLRFLARRKWLASDVSFEALRANAREVLGRGSYRTPRVDRRLPLIVTYVESLQLPAAAPRAERLRLELLRDKALIRTLFCTGVRRQEAASLNRADLDDGWSAQALITGKGSKERVIFFDQDTLAAIRAYLGARGDGYAPLFIRHDRARGKPRQGGSNYRLSPLSVWRIVKRYANLAGVPATTHDFRHAKASTLLNRGAKLSEVQDILGHASPETTKRIYAHYETSYLRQAFDRFSASPEELGAALPGQPQFPPAAPALPAEQ
jgi:integrase